MNRPLPTSELIIGRQPTTSVTQRSLVAITYVSGDDSLAALVDRAQSGDDAAVEALVRELRPRGFRSVLARVLDVYTADDGTQEVAMTVMSALPRYVTRAVPSPHGCSASRRTRSGS